MLRHPSEKQGSERRKPFGRGAVYAGTEMSCGVCWILLCGGRCMDGAFPAGHLYLERLDDLRLALNGAAHAVFVHHT